MKTNQMIKEIEKQGYKVIKEGEYIPQKTIIVDGVE